MSESSLSVSRSEILQSVGDYLEFGRNQHVWTREQTALVTRVIRSGERQFYKPPGGHSWRFLRPRLCIDIDAGEGDYDLPDTFGGFIDSRLSFVAADNQYEFVRLTSVPEVLRLRQLENLVGSIQPTLAAVNAKTSNGSTGQRYELMLFPLPTASGTLEGTYYAIPNATTDTYPYPLGGEVHAETYLASIMAAAEMEKMKQAGPLRQAFLDQLNASIAHEMRTGPKHLGYNRDDSGLDDYSLADLRATTRFTYNGVEM